MELNFKSFGSGEPVIILHGLFGMLDNWQTMAKKLAEHYTVFIIDQRNHGRSPHTDHISYPLMAEDLRQFMENQWMYTARIVGHSMGGKTAMQFTLDNPDMVERLAVIDIAPKSYPGNHDLIFEALLDVDITHLKTRGEADETLRKQIDDPGVIAFLLKNLSRNKSGGYRWKMNLPVLFRDYQNILADIRGEDVYDGPSLFVKGSRSDYITEADMSAIRTLFPAASMVEIAPSGHWVHADAPDLLYDRLVDFLG